MKDFCKEHVNNLLLSFFVIYFSLLGLHAMHAGITETPFMSAMLDNEKLVIGALLGLITGRATAPKPPEN